MEVVSHYYRLTFLNRRVRRSTLLPQARRGGGGDGEGGGGEPALAMSRAPSPIMPHHLTLPINHTFPGMGGNRTRQESLEYSFGSNKDDGDHLSYPLPEVEEVAREVSELAEEVQQLRHANRRLAGEKNHLTFHLTTAEDDLSSLRDKCRHLEKILHIKQRELQELKGLESDVELLRGQLEEEREGRARLVAQVASGEKSIMSLTDKLEEIEEQLRGAQEEMAKEHEVIRALKMINGVMEEEKQSLQEQLMLVNQEFEAFRTFSSVRSYQSAHSSRSDLSSFGFGEVNGTVDDERKTTSDDDSTTANDNQAPQHPLPPAPPSPEPPAPPTCDTPLSIHSEIQSLDEQNALLPFCGRIKKAGSEALGDRTHDESIPVASDGSFLSNLDVSGGENEREHLIPVLTTLLTLTKHFASDAGRWAEDIRQWVAVPGRRRGVGGGGNGGGEGEEEDDEEGANLPLHSPSPPLPPHLHHIPGTHSRDEIEALIRGRCEAECETGVEDHIKVQQVSWEALTTEIEKELVALRLHVARSHALLHYYQSSSLCESRSEASTPPIGGVIATHHAPSPQGVEVGVACDLCGPSCKARPSTGSTATQTPASPSPATPGEGNLEAGPEEGWSETDAAGAALLPHTQGSHHAPAPPRPRPRPQVGLRGDSGAEEEEEALVGKTDEEEKEEEAGGKKEEEKEEREVEAAAAAATAVVQEEGEEEEEVQMASDHTLYAPKPAYDQLDQYRVGSVARGPGRGVEEKTRRSGLTTITPQVGSDSEESEQDGPQLILPPRTKQPRHQEVEVAPLSPPPSLDNVKEEEEEEEEEKNKKKREPPNREKPPLLKQKTQSEERVEVEEEEPLLPSTPESGSSINSAELFARITQGGTTKLSSGSRGTLMRQPSMTTPEDPPVTTPPLHTPTNTTTAPFIVNTTDKLPIETAVSVRSERSKSCSGVFPSLKDQHLRSSGMARDEPNPHENLSAQEIENKFNQLSLIFRTDGVTLRQRLDLQQRHQDNAETNFDCELAALRDSLVSLHSECLDTELAGAVSKVRRNLDILATTNTRLLSTSEVWGAVQQEWRVSRAVEVLLLHVDNVKRMYEREHQELEELRRLLNEYQIELPITTSQPPQDAPTMSRRVRALSLAVYQSSSNKPQQETRRTSVTMSGSGRTGSFTGARTRRRASLQPDQLKPFRDQFALAAAAVAASAAAAGSAGGGGGGKGKGQEGGESSSKGMLGITEEGSIDEESGDESTSQKTSSPPAATTTLTTNNTTTIITTTTTTTTTPTTMSPLSQLPPGAESERRSSQDSTASSISYDAEPRPTPSAPTLLPHRQDSLVYIAVQRMVSAAGEWWPYSTQDTVSGVRYVVTSVLALLILCLLLALCSGSSELPEPRHPSWVNIALVRHPFVTLRYRGIRPY